MSWLNLKTREERIKSLRTSGNARVLIFRRIADALAPLGYVKERPSALRKDVGDIRWYIEVMSDPRALQGTRHIPIYVGAFSEPLERVSPKNSPPYTAGCSQVRIDLRTLAGDPAPRYCVPGWTISEPAELDTAIEEILERVDRFGLPFLSNMRSTADMIPYVRDGRYSPACLRARYDADVWEGKIDPNVLPWDPQIDPNFKRGMTPEEAIATLTERLRNTKRSE